jgi:hypothetical protein
MATVARFNFRHWPQLQEPQLVTQSAQVAQPTLAQLVELVELQPLQEQPQQQVELVVETDKPLLAQLVTFLGLTMVVKAQQPITVVQTQVAQVHLAGSK